jgi:hypothetical protein
LAVEGVGAVQPRGGEELEGGDNGGEIGCGEECDGFVVGADGFGEGFGSGEFLEGIAAVEVSDGEVAARGELGLGGAARGGGERAEERDGAIVGAHGVTEGIGRGGGFESFAAGEPGGSIGG